MKYSNKKPPASDRGFESSFISRLPAIEIEQVIAKLMKILVLLIVLSAPCYSQDLYSQLNYIRAQKGLPMLERSTKLENQSKRWLFSIRNTPGLVHTSRNVNEVLCETQANALDAWMSSKAHRQMLLDPKYKKIGFARRGNRYCGRLK